ncbi:MAG: lipoprotein [Rhodocyclaceae bacterium]|nr:lipoprotein [Rhodocyclaceae bacterium]
MRLFASIILATLLIAACGTKGPLVAPPGPAKPPLLGNPAPPVDHR